MTKVCQQTNLLLQSLVFQKSSSQLWFTADRKIVLHKNKQQTWTWARLNKIGKKPEDLTKYQTRKQALEIAKLFTQKEQNPPDFSELKMQTIGREFHSNLYPLILIRGLDFCGKSKWSLKLLHQYQDTTYTFSPSVWHLACALKPVWNNYQRGFKDHQLHMNFLFDTKKIALNHFCSVVDQTGIDLLAYLDNEKLAIQAAP